MNCCARTGEGDETRNCKRNNQEPSLVDCAAAGVGNRFDARNWLDAHKAALVARADDLRSVQRHIPALDDTGAGQGNLGLGEARARA